jgi:transcriptional regulator CtsR
MTILESIETKVAVDDKHHVLIMLLTEKFDLTKNERAFIESVNSKEQLDKALKATLTATSKEEVLALLH